MDSGCQKRIFLIIRSLVIYNGVISKKRTKKISFPLILESSSFFWVKTGNPEMRNTSSSWHLKVNDVRNSSIKEKGVEFATGNERNLCGHFAKAWTIFIEHILFFKDELYLEFKDLGSSSKSCDLDVYSLCISVLSNKTGLPYRTVGKDHWGHSLWKWFSAIQVMRMDKWHWAICLDPIHCGLLWRNTPTFSSYSMNQRALNSLQISELYIRRKKKKSLSWIIIRKIRPQNLSNPPPLTFSIPVIIEVFWQSSLHFAKQHTPELPNSVCIITYLW